MYDNAIERKVPPDIDKTPVQYAIAIKEHSIINDIIHISFDDTQ
jgi:hypothetical protein